MNRRIIAFVGLIIALLIIIGSLVVAFAIPNSPLKAILGGNTGNTPTTGLTGNGTQIPVTQGTTGKGGGGNTGTNCGVTKTSSGYTFSWLHVSNGYIMDDKNCIVNLKGFNWSQIEFGNAVGGGVKNRISAQGIAWYNQMFHMNVWRIPVNSVWWNENVNVPLAGMSYQSWVEQIVQWAAQNGDYVILTKGPQFPNPPCGGSVTFCPSQDQGKKNQLAGLAGPEQQTTGADIQSALTMWTSIAKIYANDPSVLYDSWNEMHGLDAQTWQNNENALINAIRAQNPRSLVFLGGPNYKNNINPLVNGVVSDFTESNLIYDFHIYDGFNGVYNGKNCAEPNSDLWKNWPSTADTQVGFSQQHGKAVAFSEWGGCNDTDAYNQSLTSYAQTHHICMVYYDETNVVTQIGGQLTANGLKVQAAYASL